MPPISHQTVRLGRGRHRTPDEGACVMELASMLSGEPFGAHPRAVCPVVGAFLRAYNDALDDARRQDLYVYAARVVGTTQGRRGERVRSKLLAEWLRERGHRLPRGPALPRYRRTRIARRCGEAAAASGDGEGHRSALELLDRLIQTTPDAGAGAAPRAALGSR
jgi:hypothetical protein